ncbi:MAG: TonB-dependent receptor [Bacteroidetes bacterium]|nr:TonB-dependent receptor [Bacteroidota bacterium]
MKKQFTSFKVLFLFLVWAFSTHAYAQEVKISGKVTDATDGSSIPGVTVLIKGTSKGTTTDIDGKYDINANAGTILVFSYIGYSQQEVAVGTQKSINISLKPTATGLNEVVIIGYGQVKKGDATGSVNTIGTKDFNRGAITSPQELLVGKSAGVVVTTSGGAPGAGAQIRIRGGSSLNASNDPLIIIDGIPLDNSDVSGSSNFLSIINPNDIETFTVLKDASATAIYGSRASNGVIIITTKKGQSGSTMKLNYDGNTSWSSAVKYLDVYSGDQMRKIALDHKDLFDPANFTSLGTENTNWQKEIYRTAVSQNHNVSISGAVKSLPYRVALGYTDDNGILKNTDYKRITGSINLNPSFLHNDLKVDINAKAMSTDWNFGDAGAVGSAINMDPTQPVMDGNTSTAGYFQWPTYGANLGTPNPVEQLMAADNTSKVTRMIGNIQLNYKLPFIPNLHATLNLATDKTDSKGHNNRPTTSPSTLTSPYWGKLSDYNAHNKNDLLDFYLNYTKDLSQIKSKIDLTGGYSWQHFQHKGDHWTRGNYDENHLYQTPDSSSYISENYLVSFFGRLNYTLMDKYLLTFTLRDDGSSRFSKGNQWGLFPSAAFAWKINDESFLKNVKAVSNLKLRLGWGVTGQQDIQGNDYPAQALYSQSYMGSYYMIDGEYLPTLRPGAYDPNIKWEETTTQNVGLDFGFLNDRINGSFDLYKRTTKDLLNLVTIPSGSNFSNKLITNVGSLENKGAEFTLNLVPISKNDMNLTIGFNVTYNQNKITKLTMTDDPTYMVPEGDAFTGFKQVIKVGYPAHSFFVNKQVYDANGNPIEGLYVDLSGEGGTVNGDNADKYIYHNPTPDYLLGFSFRFNYKNFDLAASSRGSIGNYVYNQVAAGSSYDQMSQIGYWKNFPTFLDDTKFVKRQFTSDYFVENASFFKLDYLSCGYKFDNLVGKLSGRISFTVQNVLTITKYTGIDPEVSGGVDNNFYPRPRTYMVGLSLSY